MSGAALSMTVFGLYLALAGLSLFAVPDRTVFARLIFFTGTGLLVLRRAAPPRLLAFGLVDLAGAAWTWFALQL